MGNGHAARKRGLDMKKTLLIMAWLAFGLAACEDNSSAPYLKIAGGGFVFNYRYSVFTYGFVAKPLRPLPPASTLEARFQLPDSDKQYVTTLPVKDGKMQYVFETQALHGVKKNTPYKVQLRLLESGTGRMLAELEQEFRSTADQASLPAKAPVRGIGYFPAPQ